MSDKVNTGNNMEDKKLIKNARKPEGKLTLMKQIKSLISDVVEGKILNASLNK